MEFSASVTLPLGPHADEHDLLQAELAVLDLGDVLELGAQAGDAAQGVALGQLLRADGQLLGVGVVVVVVRRVVGVAGLEVVARVERRSSRRSSSSSMASSSQPRVASRASRSVKSVPGSQVRSSYADKRRSPRLTCANDFADRTGRTVPPGDQARWRPSGPRGTPSRERGVDELVARGADVVRRVPLTRPPRRVRRQRAAGGPAAGPRSGPPRSPPRPPRRRGRCRPRRWSSPPAPGRRRRRSGGRSAAPRLRIWPDPVGEVGPVPVRVGPAHVDRAALRQPREQRRRRRRRTRGGRR